MNLTLNQLPVIVGFRCCIPYRKVMKTQHTIISPRLVSSFLCSSCRSLVSVCVVLSGCCQYRVVTGYTKAALPPSISIRLPLSLQFDTTVPTFCRSASRSVRSCVSIGLQLAWCCSDVTEVMWPYRSLLYPLPLAAVLSLLHPSCAGSVNVSMAAVGGGEPVPGNTGPVAMLSHLVSSSSQIPQLLPKFEKVRTLWILKGESELINGSLCRNKPDYFWQRLGWF